MTSNFEVHYHQVNAALDYRGDCAVALLVKKSATAGDKPTLKSAILIDAGNTKNTPACLVRLIKIWESEYSIPPDQKFRFDAVTLSHWDADHVGGFYHFLNTPNAWEFDDDDKDTPKKFKYFKYDKDNNPLTRLYCIPSAGTVGYKSSASIIFQKAGDSNAIVTCKLGRCKRQSKPAMVSCRTIKMDDYDPVIGRNVFTGNEAVFPDKTTNIKTITSVADLLKYNSPSAIPRKNSVNYFPPPIPSDGKGTNPDEETDPDKETWDGAPGLYIVGVNMWTLSQFNNRYDPNKANNDDGSNGKVAAAQSDTHQDDGGFGTVNIEPKNKDDLQNPNSIIMILVWPDPVRVSLYTGGDAEFGVENRVADFLKGMPVTVVKLGHHGSAAGTSMKFISQTKPSYVVLSAGTKHGHPAPETLTYLDAWYGSQTQPNDLVKPIQSISYPYTFGAVNDMNFNNFPRYFKNKLANPLKLTTDALTTSDLGLYKPWVTECQKLWKDSGRTDIINTWTPSIKALLKTSRGAISASVMLQIAQIVAQALKDSWRDWALTSMAFYPERAYDDRDSAPEGGKRLNFPQALRRMEAMKTILTADVATDGKSWVIIERPTSDTKSLELKPSDLSTLAKVPDDPPKPIPVMIKANAAITEGNGKTEGALMVSNKRQKLTDTRMSITDGLVGLELTLDEEDTIIQLAMEFDGLTISSDDDMVETTRLPMATQSKLGVRLVSDAPTAETLVFDKIYRSDAQPGNGQQKFLTTDPESEADFFISSTTSGFLTFATGIQFPATGQSWTREISSQDTLMVFMSTCFNGPMSVSSFSITGQPITENYSTTITEAKLDIAISGVSLSFSSTASNIISVLNLTTNGTASQPSDCQDVFANNGFLTNSNGVILALTTESATVDSTKCSMSDIFKFIGFQLSLALKETTTLHLVNSSPNENIVWIDLTSRWTLFSRFTFISTSNDSWLTFSISGLTFSNWSVVVAKESRPQRFTVSGASNNYLVNSGTMNIRATASLDGTGYSFETYVSVAESSIIISLRWNDRKNNPLSHLFDCILKLGIDAQSTWSNVASALGTMGQSLYLREFSVSASHGDTGWQFQTVNVSFELGLEWGITEPSSNPENRVPIWFCFTYSKDGTAPYVQFHGGLWPSSVDKQRMLQKLNPQSTGIPPLEPSFKNPQYYIPLNKVYGANNSAQVNSIPGWLPSNISRLELDLTYDLTSKATTVAFIGSMTAGSSKSGPSGPTWLSIDNVNIRASYTTAQSLDIELGAQIILKPRNPTDFTATAVVDVLIGYDRSANSSAWRIQGSVSDFNFGLLYSYFNVEDGNEALMDIMEEIDIALVEFDFDHTSSAQSFLGSGRLQLGPVWLDLVFNYGRSTTRESGWEFYADISEGFVSVDTTVGEILLDISQSLAVILPSIITGIAISLPDNCTVRIDVTKVTPGDLGLPPSSNSYILFSVRVRAGDFEFSFVQITQVYEKPSTSSTSFTPPPTKMMFKATMDKLPILNTIPLVSNFTQPFDQIDLIWLSHDLTREEVETINAKTYIDQTDKLVFNDPRLKGPVPGDSAADIVMVAGCHFMVVVQENNVPVPVIDYKFGPESSPPAPQSSALKEKNLVAATATATGTGTAAATATWTKTVGPFTISAITLKYENQHLNIFFNATLNLGLIKASVTGFGLGLPLANFPHFPTLNGDNQIKVYFTGAGLELDTPTVKLAGVFIKTDHGLEGGISIEIEPYMILAGGGIYHETNYDSTFIFAELSGPLVELEFASINDLVGGVGVNSNLVLPELENITTFPFLDSNQVKTQGAGGVLDILNKYLSGKWISPEMGTTWIAGGVGVNAFQTLEIKAVVVIDLAKDPIFGVFADMVAEVPSGVTNTAELFARMDMGVIAELNPDKGTFICHGQLNPSSFILSSQCHLLGGFALCYWFSGSGHEGDWVFTVGGYHSQFTPPTWYPVPPRVSISWQYSNEISIFGEAFFAITPKVCMGGGDLKVNFASGNLSAYLTAWADFLVNYKPFSFIASVGVTVGASYTLHLGFCSKSFSVHLGCSLDLHGPPLAGVAHIDWSIISFDIHFGQANPPNAPLLWDQFCALVRQVDTITDLDKADKTTGQHMHTISQTAGSISSQTSGPVNASSTDKWQVNSATFAFRMDTKFPVTRISYGSNHDDEAGPVFFKPMHNTTNIQSELSITFSPAVSFQYLPILKQIPVALWGPYDGTQDPSSSGNSQNLSTMLSSDNSTISRVMGMDIVGFSPTESADMLQFNIGFGASYAAATANLPDSFYITTGAGDAQSLDQAINLSTPVTPAIPNQPRTVLGRIQSPILAKNDLINSWITWSNVAADSSLATSLQNLSGSTGSALAWTKELLTAPTMPPPLLTAEATVKALMNDGTRFASLDVIQGTAGILNRDWLDGGSI